MIKKVYCESEDELFSRMNMLRGPLAIVVILSHIWGYTGLWFLVPFNKIVTIAVAFFFFLSGWGLVRSFDRKKHYLEEIACVKIPYLLWMALLAYLFSALTEYLLSLNGVDVSSYLPFGVNRFFSSTNWYVYELAGFYILFLLCMKLVRDRYQMPVVWIISVTAFVVLYRSGLVEAYYNSIIGFGLGMLCGRTKLLAQLERHKWKSFLFGLILLGCSFAAMFVMDKDSILFAAVRNLAALGAILLALCVMRYVALGGKAVSYLGRISPELYFYHMPIALLLSRRVDSAAVYLVLVFAATFIVSPLMSILNQNVRKVQRKLWQDR